MKIFKNDGVVTVAKNRKENSPNVNIVPWMEKKIS